MDPDGVVSCRVMLFTAVPLALLATEPLLVKDLLPTLAYSALGLSLAQIIRAISRGSDAYSAVLMGVLSVLLTPLVVLTLVAFGAPVISVQVETVLCSFVLSALVLQPLLTLYGLDAERWQQIVGLRLPLTDVYFSCLFAALGAWLGAVPIALDWDRPWQRYPITIVMGSYVGSLVGELVGMCLPRARVKEAKKSKRSASK